MKQLLVLMCLTMVCVIVCMAFAAPKEKPVDPPVMTGDEKFKMRTQQMRVRDLRNALQAAEIELNNQINEAYANHNITNKEWALCSDPTPGVCANAPFGDIVFMPIVKKESESPPEVK